MNTPQRDPLGAAFDRYAEITAAEAAHPTPGRLRSRVHRRRSARSAAAGVAAAVLVIPAGWALQQAGTAEEAPIAAGEQSAPCEEVLPIVVLPEGATLEEYLAAEVEALAVVIPTGATLEQFYANPEDVEVRAVPEGADFTDHFASDEYSVVVEISEDGVVQMSDEPTGESASPDYEPTRTDDGPTPTGDATPTGGSTPTEDSNPTGESTPCDDETSEGPTPGGDETSEGPTPGGDETSEEPTPGDDETSQGPTPGDDEIIETPTP